MHIHRSTVIDAPKDLILQTLSDFHTWPHWSPWLIAEPDAEIEIAPDGKSYSWLGSIVGAGEMSVTGENTERVYMDLLFFKPYKSKAKVTFEVKEISDGCKVTWSMESKLPLLLFWMRRRMEAYIASDYDRGLSMLREYIETGKVLSKIEYLGMEDFEGIKYLGIRRQCGFEDMQKSMGPDFETLMTRLEAGNGAWFSLYHKFDRVNDRIDYTACVGVDEYPEDVPSDWIKGQLPASRVYVTRHTGSYDHMGNAWSAAMMQMRAKTFRPDRKSAAMEIYRNSPTNTAPADLITDVCFVVKS